MNNGTIVFSKRTRLAIQVVVEQHVHVAIFSYWMLFQSLSEADLWKQWNHLNSQVRLY